LKILLIIAAFSIGSIAYSQKEKGFAYVDKYKDIAIKEMQRSGVPAAITLAQGILESRFGESDLSQKSNNHFGIKCKLDWNGEKVYHDDDSKQECFRKYETVADSYKDHSDFLKSRPHYASLFNLDPTNFEAWAYGLKKAGYATESNYPEMLMKVIGDYNLNQYTLMALNAPLNNSNDKSETSTAILPQKIINTTIVEDEKDEVETSFKKTSTVIKQHNENYPNGFFEINGTKVMYVSAGTSLLALANNNNISLSKILEINDLEEMEILEKNQLIYFEKKQKKGLTDFHIAAHNESLHDIAQKEGIRLDMLLEYNSTHKKLNPVVGEKIYLRSKASVPPKMTSAVATSNKTIDSSIN